jgi:hypothetical protein
MTQHPYRQLVFLSEARDDATVPYLLENRLRYIGNNAGDGVGSVLLTSGPIMGELIEGPPDGVGATIARILANPSHAVLAIVHDQHHSTRLLNDVNSVMQDHDHTNQSIMSARRGLLWIVNRLLAIPRLGWSGQFQPLVASLQRAKTTIEQLDPAAPIAPQLEREFGSPEDAPSAAQDS